MCVWRTARSHEQRDEIARQATLSNKRIQRFGHCADVAWPVIHDNERRGSSSVESRRQIDNHLDRETERQRDKETEREKHTQAGRLGR